MYKTSESTETTLPKSKLLSGICGHVAVAQGNNEGVREA